MGGSCIIHEGGGAVGSVYNSFAEVQGCLIICNLPCFMVTDDIDSCPWVLKMKAKYSNRIPRSGI